MDTAPITRRIGTRVRAGRARIGMTRKQLAAAAEVSERYLNELENGDANASVAILAKVADALGLDLVSLLSADDASPGVAAQPAFEPLASLMAGMSLAEQQAALPVLDTFITDRRRRLRGIALLGLRGAGKSTIGRLFAARHGLGFISVTREIEARAGMSLAELFNLGGPDAYRSLENEVIAELTRRPDRLVLETAGGIVGNNQALDMILGAFKTVWLKATPEEHLARVSGQGDTRPMRGHPKALEHLRALLAAREPDYARAESVIDTSGRTVEDCVADLERIAGGVVTQDAA
ncbi:MAG TPA: shikimate kinase [Hyphomicrobiaceae bacterium]|nr:shikimate kinase [Hyphomicrobiaceae bacterium]